MVLPAAVNAVAVAENPAGGAIVSYDGYVPALRTVAMLIFVALEAPNLVSADLRNHTLPLYFARPIKRIDYPVAKLIAFILACLAMIEIPLLVLYIGNMHASANGAERGLGADQAARSWPAVRGSLGGAAGERGPAAGQRPPVRRVFAICAIAIPLFFTWILATVLMQSALRRSGRRATPSRRRWPAWPG